MSEQVYFEQNTNKENIDNNNSTDKFRLITSEVLFM
jgi:hypothetical protein